MTDPQRIKLALPWVILPLWLTLTAWAFWWFDARLQRPFAEDLAPFARLMDSPVLPLALSASLQEGQRGDAEVTLVHFRDPDCPCNRFNQPHLDTIVTQYGAEGVRFVTVDAGAAATGDGGFATRLSGWLPVPASPAALVVGREGEIAYFGPYSTGAGCITGSGTFVERALERALEGTSKPQMNVLNTGCYCSWPSGALDVRAT